MTMHCHECSAPLAPYCGRGQRSRFCGVPCRRAFNNRRAQRGAVLYDLFMASRFERGAADHAGARSIMARLASEWNMADDGRRTWGDWQEWIAQHPAFNPAAVKRHGSV